MLWHKRTTGQRNNEGVNLQKRLYPLEKTGQKINEEKTLLQVVKHYSELTLWFLSLYLDASSIEVVQAKK